MIYATSRQNEWHRLADQPAEGLYHFPEELPPSDITGDEVQGLAAIFNKNYGDAFRHFERCFERHPTHALPWARKFYTMGQPDLSSYAFYRSAQESEKQPRKMPTDDGINKHLTNASERNNLNDYLNAIAIICNDSPFHETLIDEMPFKWDGDLLDWKQSTLNSLSAVRSYLNKNLKRDPLLSSKILKYLLKTQPGGAQIYTPWRDRLVQMKDTMKGERSYSEFQKNLRDLDDYFKEISEHYHYGSPKKRRIFDGITRFSNKDS